MCTRRAALMYMLSVLVSKRLSRTGSNEDYLLLFHKAVSS